MTFLNEQTKTDGPEQRAVNASPPAIEGKYYKDSARKETIVSMSYDFFFNLFVSLTFDLF